MADISKITLPNNAEYDLKDATARSGLANKQDTLVSGTNIKTINNESILGSGDISVLTTETDPVFTASPAHDITSTDIDNLEILDNSIDNSGIGYITESNVILSEVDLQPFGWSNEGTVDFGGPYTPVVSGKTYSVSYGNSTYQTVAEAKPDGTCILTLESSTIATTQTAIYDATLSNYMSVPSYYISSFDKTLFTNNDQVAITINGALYTSAVYDDGTSLTAIIWGADCHATVGYAYDGQVATLTGGTPFICVEYETTPGSIEISIRKVLIGISCESSTANAVDGCHYCLFNESYIDSPPQTTIPVAISLVGETFDRAEKINSEFINYGDILANAAQLGGIGYYYSPQTVIETTTPTASAWETDYEGGMWVTISNVSTGGYTFNNDGGIEVHYGDYVLIGTATSGSYGTGFGAAVWDNYGHSIQITYDPDELTLDIYGNLPCGSYPLKIVYYPLKSVINQDFLPNNISVYWSNILQKPDVIGNPNVHAVYYGYCTTSASTVAKTVSPVNFPSSLSTGMVVVVRFSYGNTATNPTLKVGTTAAKTIYRIRGNSTSAAASGAWSNGEVITFVYDGSYWVMVNGGRATTTEYGDVMLSTSTSSTSTSLAATPSAVKSAYDLAGAAIPKTDIATSVSSSSTNTQVPSAKLFYDTIGDVESVLTTLLEGTS